MSQADKAANYPTLHTHTGGSGLANRQTCFIWAEETLELMMYVRQMHKYSYD